MLTEYVDERWMERALDLARCAFDKNEVPVGAVVVMDGEIIGEGYNQVISQSDPSAHAEVLALRDAAKKINNYRMPGAWLYVTIEPCTMCLGTIIHARVEGLIYGASEPKAGVLASYPQLLDSGRYNHRPYWRGGIKEHECSALIQSFFRRRRDEKRMAKSLRNL